MEQTVRACGTAPPRRLIETTLTSSDGLLIARPDYVDLQAQEIVDYKTGASLDDAAAMSAAEVRQLNLYVHLALENDLAVSRGVIVRPDGRRAVAEVTKAEANAEGQRAMNASASVERYCSWCITLRNNTTRKDCENPSF